MANILRFFRIFLNIQNIQTFQNLDYSIYVIEQYGSLSEPFNRAKLFNIGVIEGIFNHEIRALLESSKNEEEECYCLVLHDIDMLPVSEISYYHPLCIFLTNRLNNDALKGQIYILYIYRKIRRLPIPAKRCQLFFHHWQKNSITNFHIRITSEVQCQSLQKTIYQLMECLIGIIHH